MLYLYLYFCICVYSLYFIFCIEKSIQKIKYKECALLLEFNRMTMMMQ